MTGRLFNIQDFAVQDGPGIRTVLFMKGCPMRCHWCANPEGQQFYPELMHSQNICKQCRKCGEVCPEGAITFGADGFPSIQREKCADCTSRACEANCIPKAIKVMGQDWTVEDLFQKVRQNNLFYRNSLGGVTLSGGEALAQPKFVREFLARCATIGLSVGVETCGYFQWEQVEDFIGELDFFYFDLKCLESELHQKVTERGNRLILENLRRVAELDPTKVVVTVAVIPGVNDTEEMMQSVAELCRELGVEKMRLLPYHSMGSEKYRELGREYLMSEGLKVENQRMAELRQAVEDAGVECWVE